MVELQEENLTLLQEIYRDSQGRTKVYFAKLRHGRETLDVAVKEIICRGNIEVYAYIEECLNQLRIESSNVCKIYGWLLKAQEIKIVMERLGSDLSKEIALRKNAQYFYTEIELLRLLWDVGQVFTKLQRLNVSHNDIKAENIFVQKLEHGRVEFKVGDFGSASKVHKWEHSLTGTPLYLSPILKVEYNRFLRTKERREIVYNTFKSDAYSLGVTMIYLAELTCPNDLQDFVNLKSKINSHIASIAYRYPRLSTMLANMLDTDEAKRWDFIELENALRRIPEVERYNLEKSEGNTQLPAEEPSDGGRELIAELQSCFDKEEWTFMRTILSTKHDKMNLIEAHCKHYLCPNCFLEVVSAVICPHCSRPTGLIVSSARQ